LRTGLLLEAIKLSGVRALLSAGWSKIGGSDIPENVFLLGESSVTQTISYCTFASLELMARLRSLYPGDCPHDWLFADGRVSAVVIHGGAGTTAIALKNGLPVVVGK
jgi:sterol 3beta-glucosyltransferase